MKNLLLIVIAILAVSIFSCGEDTGTKPSVPKIAVSKLNSNSLLPLTAGNEWYYHFKSTDNEHTTKFTCKNLGMKEWEFLNNAELETFRIDSDSIIGDVSGEIFTFAIFNEYLATKMDYIYIGYIFGTDEMEYLVLDNRDFNNTIGSMYYPDRILQNQKYLDNEYSEVFVYNVTHFGSTYEMHLVKGIGLVYYEVKNESGLRYYEVNLVQCKLN